jgi:glycosyltransferase involved in cell wall biosynthesis
MHHRILFVSHFDHARMGGQQSMLDLIKHLDRSRFTPLLLCQNRGELSAKAEALGCKVLTMPLLDSIKPKHIRHIAETIRAARQILEEERITIVHPDHERDTLVFGIAARLARVRMVWHVRLSQREKFDRINRTLASSVICVSNGVAEERFGRKISHEFYQKAAHESALAPHSKYRTIYNGVDCESFTPPLDKVLQRLTLELPLDKKILGFVGQLKTGKGIFDLIEALRQLKTASPETLPLTLMFGTALDDDDESRLHAAIREAGLQENIQLMGQREDIWRWMQVMDVLILPSHEGVEGMGRVLAEAQACGVATIGTNITGVREVVPTGVGLMVQPHSPASIAEALHFVFSRPSELARLQRVGRAFALVRFDSKRHARKVEQEYSHVLRLSTENSPNDSPAEKTPFRHRTAYPLKTAALEFVHQIIAALF